MGKKMPSLVKAGLLLAFGLGVTNAFAVDACNEDMGHPGNGTQISVNQTGSINGTPWGFEQWSGGGNMSMTYYSNGTFKANWSNNQDYLARVGYRYGDNGPGIDHNTKHFTVDYKYTKTGSAQYGYIGVYGWTVNPQVEYYIVDDWYSKPSEQYIGAKRGEITVDGATYTIHAYLRQSEPSKTGTSTFLQIFSVRESPRTCGHIDISAHFKKWDEMFTGQQAQLAGSKGGGSTTLKFGKPTEVMLMAEAGGNASGSIDYTYFNMSDNGEASPVTSNPNTDSDNKGDSGNQGGGMDFGGGQGGGMDFGGGQGGGFDFGGMDFGNMDWGNMGGGQGGGFDFGGGQGGGFDFGGMDFGNMDFGNMDFGNMDFGNMDWGNMGGGQGGFDFGGGQGGGFDWGGGQGGGNDEPAVNNGGNSGADKIDTSKIVVNPVTPNGNFAALPSELKILSASKTYKIFNTQGRYLGNVELQSGMSLNEAIFNKFGKAGIYMVKNGSKAMTVKVSR